MEIFLLVSSINLGDVSQANAILASLKKFADVEVVKIDANQDFLEANSEYLTQVKSLPDQQKYITLAIGEKAMELLEFLEINNSIDYARSYTCLSIHQYFKDIARLKLNHIIVPEATIDQLHEKEAIEKIPHKTLTFAVASNNPSLDD